MFSSTLGAVRYIAACDFQFKARVYHNPNYKPRDGVPGIAVFASHGTFDTPRAFEETVEKMLASLPDCVEKIFLVEYVRRGEGIGIDDYAEQLFKFILESGYTHFILIGHSRGGLVNAFCVEYLLKAYLQEHGLSPDALKPLGVIHVSVPIGGSHLAPLAPWLATSIEQMQPGHAFVHLLMDLITHSKYKHLFHTGLYDWVVKTIKSYLPDDLSTVTFYDYDGHLSILGSDRCARNICAQLWELCLPYLPFDVSLPALPLDNFRLQRDKVKDYIKPSAPVSLKMERETSRLKDQGREKISLDKAQPECLLADKISLDMTTLILKLMHIANNDIILPKVKVLLALKKTVLQALDEGQEAGMRIGHYMQAYLEKEKVFKPRGFMSPIPLWEQVVRECISLYDDIPFPLERSCRLSPMRKEKKD